MTEALSEGAVILKAMLSRCPTPSSRGSLRYQFCVATHDTIRAAGVVNIDAFTPPFLGFTHALTLVADEMAMKYGGIDSGDILRIGILEFPPAAVPLHRPCHRRIWQDHPHLVALPSCLTIHLGIIPHEWPRHLFRTRYAVRLFRGTAGH
jgi:hypothetical protein